MRGRLNRRAMQVPRAPATLTIKAIIIGVIFATTCTTTTKAANTCTPDNGGCCLATLRDGDVTDAELLPFHEQADGEPGVIVDDLTTGIDYELFFTLTMKNQFDENNAAIDKLLGVPLNALLENTANSFAKQPAVMGLAMITEEENGRWQQKRDWVPPADKDDIPEGKCLDPSGATSAERTTSCPIQGVQNMPYLFVHSKRGVVLAVNDHDGSAYMPGHNANTRVGQGWRHTKNKVGYSKDNNGGALLGTDKYPSVTHIVDAADNNFIVVKTPVPPGYLYDTNTLAGETYQDALLGTHDIRLVVSGSRTAIFIGTELMHESYTLDTKDVRPVYTNMRVKMGSAAIDHQKNKNLIKPQINPPSGTKIKNVRYYRRNSNWNKAYACKAEKTCLELKEGSAVADHWHFNYVAGVCGISKLGAGAATCNTETDRWFEAEATCTAMGARLCTEAEVKKSALVPRASYAHKYVLIKDTATCQDEGLEYIESKVDCEEAASAEHLDQFDKEAATVNGISVPYGCYYRAQFLSYNRGSAKSTTKDGYYGICKNPAFADNSNQAVEVYADGTKDTGFCENVAETQPIWVADPCDTGNGNGLGHKVLVSTGKGYATAGCIDEMIQLQDSPKDGDGNRIKPAVRCCASGTGEPPATATTTTATATTATTTSSTSTSTLTSTTHTSTTSTVTTTTITTVTVTTTTTTTTTTTSTTVTTSTTTTSMTTTTITTTSTATTTTTTTTTYTTTTTTTTTATTTTTTTATTTTTTLNAEQLKENGATIKELLDGGMDVAELVDKGFLHLELVQDLDANITVADLEDAGVPAADITALRSRLADLEKGSNLGIIIGAVVAVVVIVGIILFCVCRSKESGSGSAIPSSKELGGQTTRRDRAAAAKRGAGNAPAVAPRSALSRLPDDGRGGLMPPTLIQGEHKKTGKMEVARLSLNAFNALPTNHAAIEDLPPAIAKNLKAFNRYKNILPNVHSRVNLEQIGSDTTSRFINANFVADAGNNPKAYIAAQGPKPETVVAFWRMIWQENVRALVMVTGLMEGEKQKCARYWPEKVYDAAANAGTVKYGDVRVRVIAGIRKEGYKVAILNVYRNDEPVREIRHYWFDTWPDYGVPDDTAVVPRMLKDVSEFSTASDQPWVVHCSAGIGRTGTFIGIDIGMAVLEASRRVDTVSIVEYMRRDRGGMVQTPEQCEFVNESLQTYAEERNQSMAASEFEATNEVLYGNVKVLMRDEGSAEASTDEPATHLYGNTIDDDPANHVYGTVDDGAQPEDRPFQPKMRMRSNSILSQISDV